MKQDDRWAEKDAAWLAAGAAGTLGKELYRMPVGFGRAASQRNHPTDKADFVNPGYSPTFRVTALTEAAALAPILPPGVLLRGRPQIQVSATHVQEAYWLGGRGYHSMMARIPVTVVRGEAPIDGYYYAVKWDSLPDLVMTAREDIGWPSLWADVSPPIREGANAYRFHASWLGFRFFDMEIRNLGEPQRMPRDDSPVQVTYKYIPTGYGPGADTSKLIVNDLTTYWKNSTSISGPAVDRINNMVSVRRGTGSFAFHEARWEDMPSQYHVVNTMARIPILEVLMAEAIDSPYM